MGMNPNIDAHEGQGGSALHVAIKWAGEDPVWRLLEMQPYVNAVSEDGTPLALAIKDGMNDVARELMRRGVSILFSLTLHFPVSSHIYACTTLIPYCIVSFIERKFSIGSS